MSYELTKNDLEFLDRIGAWTHRGLKSKILRTQSYVKRVGKKHLEEVGENKVIVNRLKKRIEEVSHAHTDTRRLVWTLDAFAIVKLELKHILGDKA